jgi:uncharacterized delta-60 repeat protein
MRNAWFRTAVAMLAVLLPLAGVAGPVSAAPGYVDGSFGVGGRVETVVGQGAAGNAVVVQADDRIVVAGATLDARGAEVAGLVARYLPAGGVDATFGSQGSVTTTVGTGGSAAARAVALQGDGKMVVAGDFLVGGDERGIFVARYGRDGTLDPTFGRAGLWTAPLGQYGDSLQAVAVDGSGRVVAAGYATGGAQCAPGATGLCHHDLLVVRLTPAGQPDPTFGSGGLVVDSIGSDDDEGNAVIVDGAGRIVVAGETRVSGSEVRLAVGRYLSNGTPDAGFGQAGHGIYLPGGFVYGHAVAVQPDGRLLVGGAVSGGALLVRLLDSGQTDPSWAGQVIVNGDVRAIAVRPDARVLAAATDWTRSFVLMRYRADGYADASFGGVNGGFVTTRFHPWNQNYGSEVVGGMGVQSDGRVIAAGATSWVDSGTVDHAIGIAGFLQETAPGPPASITARAGDQEITLSWDPPADTGGLPITQYNVIEPGVGPVASVPGSTHSFVVTGLANGSSHQYTIVAVNYLGVGPGATTASATPQATPPPPARSGYWMLSTAGTVYPFGDARPYGNGVLGSIHIEPTSTGNGYWILNGNGTVNAYGDARPQPPVSLRSGETAVSLSATPDDLGYWVFTTKGRAIPVGDAPVLGDMSDRRLNAPVLGSVSTPSGHGYWMVAADGGIFTFGDARFYGSTGNMILNKPVMAMAPDPDGVGYWLVASDGGIFSFQADFHGSMGGHELNRPVSGMVPGKAGYLMVAEDGGIFSFGDVTFHGSLGSTPPPNPIASVALLPSP